MRNGENVENSMKLMQSRKKVSSIGRHAEQVRNTFYQYRMEIYYIFNIHILSDIYFMIYYIQQKLYLMS